jgi:glycosyltransferase involved in cell wall biosynthesis
VRLLHGLRDHRLPFGIVKIAIDLQACQTPESSRRGIGRYSLALAQAIARNRGAHSVQFLLNRAFADEGSGLQRELEGEQEALVETYRLVGYDAASSEDRKKLARLNDELLNWRYACTGADAVHISSVFEGWLTGDAHVSGKIDQVPGAIRSATLFDLIPLLFDDAYLSAPARADYFARLAVFHQLDLVFAISESARHDAIRRLNIPSERIVNIGAAASAAFHRLPDLTGQAASEVLSRHGIGQRFILYTGGMDYRKNLDFLLDAYAALPAEVRGHTQLIVTCEVTPESHRDLQRRAAERGIDGQTIFTGFVTDEDLNVLYNRCELFVFPSLYEGFGLPLLEAMACGACVLASNTSSMPEIVGRPDALFDPTDVASLVRMLHALLAAPDRRRELGEFNVHRARLFSWEKVAQTFIGAIEDAHARRQGKPSCAPSMRRARVALVSPLLPQRTGIAEYCTSMLPHWSRHFDLELLADGYVPQLDGIVGSYPIRDLAQFRGNANRFDSILYHFGNSPYHASMYALLPRYPGIVVMHDFFLSGLVQWMDHTGGVPGLFSRELAIAHREEALLEIDAMARDRLPMDTLATSYPISRRVIEHARGVIFHSQFARQLALDTYPDLALVPSCVVPQACFVSAPDPAERQAARERLGLKSDDVLVCAFGFLVETKDNPLLLEALASRSVADDERIRVAFVGALEAGPLRSRIDRMLAQHPMRSRITITGYVDGDEYMRYLAACDIGVSLRSNSRGETSAAMLKQLAAGCATIVSDHAAMSELPANVALKVPAAAEPLARALELLAHDPRLRAQFGLAAKRWVEQCCQPAHVADQYACAIALLTELDHARCARRLVTRIAGIADQERLDATSTAAAAEAVAAGLALHPASGRWLERPS